MKFVHIYLVPVGTVCCVDTPSTAAVCTASCKAPGSRVLHSCCGTQESASVLLRVFVFVVFGGFFLSASLQSFAAPKDDVADSVVAPRTKLGRNQPGNLAGRPGLGTQDCLILDLMASGQGGGTEGLGQTPEASLLVHFACCAS